MKSLTAQYFALLEQANEAIDTHIEAVKATSSLIYLQTNEAFERQDNLIEFDGPSGWESYIPISINTEQRFITCVPYQEDDIEGTEDIPWDERHPTTFLWADISGLNLLIIADLIKATEKPGYKVAADGYTNFHNNKKEAYEDYNNLKALGEQNLRMWEHENEEDEEGTLIECLGDTPLD